MAKRRPSGDGMVRKRDDGRWEGRIVVGHKSNGDSIFRYLSAGSQKELLAKLHRNIEEYRDVDLREESKMPLGEWLDRWLEEYAASGWTAGWRNTPPPRCGPPHWKDTGDMSSGISSPAWGTNRWERSLSRISGSCTGNSRSTAARRSTRNTGTSWPVPLSAASTASSTRPWTRQHRKT